MKTTATLAVLPLLAGLTSGAPAMAPEATATCQISATAGMSKFVPFNNAGTNSKLVYDMQMAFSVMTPWNKKPVYINASMDTGSMGVAIGAKLLKLSPEVLAKYDNGSEFLDSSGVLWEGNWIKADDVNLTLTSGNVLTKVPILAIYESSICHKFLGKQGCADGQKTNITSWPENHYFGVGFGRWSQEQPSGQPDKIPLINVVSIDNVPVSKTKYHQGYIINSTGVQVGLTRFNTRGFSAMSLGTTASDYNGSSYTSGKDWAMPAASIAVDDGAYSTGNALFDTGIQYSYLRLNAQQSALEKTHYVPDAKNPKKQHKILTSDSTVHLRIGNGPNYIAYYNVTVGSVNNPMRPQTGQFRTEAVDGTTYINTGIRFFRGFDSFLDQQCGHFGLKWKNQGTSAMGGNYPVTGIN